MNMNITVAQTTPERTASIPKAAIKAPAKPPIKVCEEEDGIPSHQVSRFQAIAESNPAKIMGKGCSSGEVNCSCTTLEMVFATL